MFLERLGLAGTRQEVLGEPSIPPGSLAGLGFRVLGFRV